MTIWCSVRQLKAEVKWLFFINVSNSLFYFSCPQFHWFFLKCIFQRLIHLCQPDPGFMLTRKREELSICEEAETQLTCSWCLNSINYPNVNFTKDQEAPLVSTHLGPGQSQIKVSFLSPCWYLLHKYPFGVIESPVSWLQVLASFFQSINNFASWSLLEAPTHWMSQKAQCSTNYSHWLVIAELLLLLLLASRLYWRHWLYSE